MAPEAPIFISYARKDKKFVGRLEDDLRSAGIETWLDVVDIATGERWDRIIQDAIRDCAYLLVVLSPNSVVSDNVLNEIDLALELNKPIYPLLYHDCEIPLQLRRKNYIDFTGDYPSALTTLLNELNAKQPPALQKQAIFSRRTIGISAVIGAAALTLLIAGGIHNWGLPWGTATPTATITPSTTYTASAAPTTTQPHTSQTPALTLTPTATYTPTIPPTSTPLVSSPLLVTLNLENCEDRDRAHLEENIRNAGGHLTTGVGAQMQIDLRCEGDQTMVSVYFPETPAYRIEFLDEAPSLTLVTGFPYARAFVQAAIAYASGNYKQASLQLLQSVGSLDAFEAYYLHAQTYMHLEQWGDARDNYTFALEGWPEADATMRAQAYGGHGLAYILEVEQQRSGFYSGDQDTYPDCVQYARRDFDNALNAQPDRALWWAGRALARWQCADFNDDDNLIYTDAEKARSLSEGDAPREYALASSILAKAYLYIDSDYLQAIELAQQAVDFAPEFPSPYRILTCIHVRENNADAASTAHEAYLANVVLSWRRQEALQELETGYCPLMRPESSTP